MTPETIALVHYGITSAFWLGVVWIGVRAVTNIITARQIGKQFDRFGR